MSFFRIAFVLASCLFAAIVRAGGLGGNDYLAATFNTLPFGQIGTGGALSGEPVSISPSLQAFVVPPGLFATPALRITPLAAGTSRFVRFEFLDNREITAGELRIGFVLRPAQVDRFFIRIREPGTATAVFLDLNLIETGAIVVSDAANPGVLIGTYTAGALMAFELRFHLDTSTYDILLNGAVIASNLNHGISSRGIGSIYFGSDNQTTVGSNWFIDDVYAYRPDEVFANGFE